MPYQKGQRWIAQVRKEGKRLEKVFWTKKEALSWEVKMRRKPAGDWNDKTATVCIGDWVQAYLDYAEARFTVKTYKEKRALFRLFLGEVPPEQPVANLKPGDVMNYIVKQSKERSGYSANKDRKNLVAAWNWGMKYMKPQLPGPNPCAVERMQEIRHPRYVPPEEDVWRVYDAAEGQDQVMMLAYIHLCARRRELFRLRWEDDVDFGNRRIRLSTRKRQDGSMEYDWLPMTDDLYARLMEHRLATESEWVFLNPETEQPFRERKRWVKALCRKAGVKPFGLHAIRHLNPSLLAKYGVPAMQIMTILRHKRLSTTQRYLHQLGDVKQALQLLARKEKPSEKPSGFQAAETENRMAS
jgi:integrase